MIPGGRCTAPAPRAAYHGRMSDDRDVRRRRRELIDAGLAGEDVEAPVYTEEHPPTIADFLYAARRAAKELRKLKP